MVSLTLERNIAFAGVRKRSALTSHRLDEDGSLYGHLLRADRRGWSYTAAPHLDYRPIVSGLAGVSNENRNPIAPVPAH